MEAPNVAKWFDEGELLQCPHCNDARLLPRTDGGDVIVAPLAIVAGIGTSPEPTYHRPHDAGTTAVTVSTVWSASKYLAPLRYSVSVPSAFTEYEAHKHLSRYPSHGFAHSLLD